MNPLPLVSIVIPVYNGSNYLRDSIESALNQTYQNCEIIVVNDGSTDNGATERIALSYGDRIKYYSKKNGGVSSALNFAIEHFSGDYFSWLSHDDLFLPHKTQSQIDFIAGRTDVVVYGDFEIIDSLSKYVKTRRERAIASDCFKFHLIFSHPVHGCTVLIPKNVLSHVGRFNESLKTIQDYDLWYRIAKEFKFVHLKDVVSQYRIHNSQGSVAAEPECIFERSVFYKKCFDEILDDWDPELPISKLYFYMRASVAFSNCSCTELAEYASNLTMSLIKNGKWKFTANVFYWLPVFLLFYFLRLKRTKKNTEAI